MRVKVNRKNAPTLTSKRSERRMHRHFVDVETSTRKGRRMIRRSKWARTISDIVYPAGTKHEINANLGKKLSAWIHTAGGSQKYHKV